MILHHNMLEVKYILWFTVCGTSVLSFTFRLYSLCRYDWLTFRRNVNPYINLGKAK